MPPEHDHDDEGEVSQSRRPAGWLIGLLVVGVLTIVFITQNRRRIPVDFVVFDAEARTWVVILISMVLGGVLTELIRLALRRRRASRA